MSTVKDYNRISAEMYPKNHYYDRETTDKDTQDEFEDDFNELKKFDKKLKNELLKGNDAKLTIQGSIELE